MNKLFKLRSFSKRRGVVSTSSAVHIRINSPTDGESITVTLTLGIIPGNHAVIIDWGYGPGGPTTVIQDTLETVSHTYPPIQGDYFITITNDLKYVIAFGIHDQPNVYFDWNLKLFPALRYVQYTSSSYDSNNNPNWSNNSPLDLSKLTNVKNLEWLSIDTPLVTGNLSNLIGKPLSYISVNNTNIVGDVSDLQNNPYTLSPFLQELGYNPSLLIYNTAGIVGDVSNLLSTNIHSLNLSDMDLSYSQTDISDSYQNMDISLDSIGLTSNEVDQLIIDLDSMMGVGVTGWLSLMGNELRSSASDSALVSLNNKGYTIAFDR